MRKLNVLALLLSLASLSACQLDGASIAHQRSIAELNQKAQSLMHGGDYAGAVARLESAHDLEPDNVQTLHNLAIAYQQNGQFDKAANAFAQLLEKPGIDKTAIYQSLGVTLEAQGDELLGKAAAIEDDPKKAEEDPKLAGLKPEQLKGEGLASYEQAVNAYQQAMQGSENPDQLAAQIEALQKKIENPDDPMAG